jgi:membrane-associated phospholipid phosphatase
MNGTEPAFPERSRSTDKTFLATLGLNIARQDVIAATFHFYTFVRAILAPDGADAEIARRFSFALLAITVITIALVRGEVLPRGRARSVIYRTGLFFPMVLSYFEMRFLLPALEPNLVDAQLMAIDEAIFGVSPVFTLQALNQYPLAIEWLSVAYYSYFYIMALMLLPSLYLESHRVMAELLAGALIICAVGHVFYTLVPGGGPVLHIAFDEPLNGGFFLDKVFETVSAAGAQYDVFPSLHTAYLTYFALVAYGRRREPIFKVVFPILAVIAAHMIVATVALRWHWAIDVIAGLALAIAARLISFALVKAELGRKEEGRQELWEPLRSSEVEASRS